MKKILLITFASTVLFACKKDKATNPVDINSPLIGKWIIKKDSVNFYSGNHNRANTQIYQYTGTNFIQFNKDGTGNNSDTITFTYTVKNNAITFYDKPYYDGVFNHPADTSTAQISLATSTNLNLYFDFKLTKPTVTENENDVYEYLTKQ